LLDRLSVSRGEGGFTHRADGPSPPFGILTRELGVVTPAICSDMRLIIAIPPLMTATVECSSPAETQSAGGPFSSPVLAITGAVNGLERRWSAVLIFRCTTMCPMHDIEWSY
jgi:hypothetical protein